MSYSVSYTESATFTVTHARHMAAKVATDLKRMQRFYGSPRDAEIAEFETEATEMIKAGYVETVTYGFKRNGNWIEPTLRYIARDLFGTSANDDDPGRVRPGADVSSATFYSYMTYTSEWFQLAEPERAAFRRGLPFSRSGAPEPGITGYLANDRTYSSGGRALDRASVRNFR